MKRLINIRFESGGEDGLEAFLGTISVVEFVLVGSNGGDCSFCGTVSKKLTKSET